MNMVTDLAWADFNASTISFCEMAVLAMRSSLRIGNQAATPELLTDTRLTLTTTTLDGELSGQFARSGDHATNVAELVYYAATGDYYQDRDMPRNG
mgnify:CR=1 FL=1